MVVCGRTLFSLLLVFEGVTFAVGMCEPELWILTVILLPYLFMLSERRPTAYITCVVAGVESASDADTSEAVGMLTEAADSTTSGACFVGRRSTQARVIKPT
jgi:hypothetical protein